VQQALADRADVALLVITPGTPAELRRLRAERGLRLRLLSDPSWSLYRAWGLRRGRWRELWLSPATWGAYVRLLARGRWPRLPAQDISQLGGDAVIDRHGLVTWVYRSRHPADRPPVSELGRQLAAAGEPGATR
jgi:hypothetical protein